MNTRHDLTIAYTDDYQRWQLGEGHPTDPVRALIATRLLRSTTTARGLSLLELTGIETPRDDDAAELGRVHDAVYLRRLAEGRCNEWSGTRPRLGSTALTMWRGTRLLAERLADRRDAGDAPSAWFNPQGAKHHARRASSGGFCALNDMAWAAAYLTDERGLRVAYLDWDAHHGDGVEELMRGRADVPTHSVHQRGIYPGTGARSSPEDGAFNYPLAAGDGDIELIDSVGAALATMRGDDAPDVILLACGADGLSSDPLSSLEYTVEGIAAASRLVAVHAAATGADVLIGGAGGYVPRTSTPLAWAITVSAVAGILAEAAHAAA